MTVRIYCCFFLALLGVLTLNSAHAAFWQAQQKVVLTARYDTNLALNTRNATEARGSDLLWLGELERKTLISSLSSELQLSSKKRNTEEDIFDSDDQKAAIEYVRSWQKSGLAINLDYSRDSTLATEFLLESASLIDARKRREKYAVNTQGYINVSALDTIVLSYFQGETQYRDSGIVITPLNDFSEQSFSSNWQRSITPNFTSQLVAFRLETDALDINKESKTQGGEIGFIYEFSEFSSLNAMAGYRNTTRVIGSGQNSKIEVDSTGSVYQLDYKYERETSDFHFGLSRNIDPDVTDGDLVEKSQATFSYRRYWRHNLSTRLSYFLFRQKPDEMGLSSRLESSQYGLAIQAGVSENIDLDFRYQYLERDLLDISEGMSKGNIYLISLIYRNLGEDHVTVVNEALKSFKFSIFL